LTPDSLNLDLEDVILSRLKETYINTCNKKYGYILDIIRIISYESETISPVNFFPRVKVVFEIKHLKPKTGMRIEGNVFSLQDKFILVIIQEKIKILASRNELEKTGFKYDHIGACFKNKTENIRIGDKVSLEIFLVNTEDFKCLGTNVKLIRENKTILKN
jgi:DNA-directed RNA polymerase subunit E'/Rpb7